MDYQKCHECRDNEYCNIAFSDDSLQCGVQRRKKAIVKRGEKQAKKFRIVDDVKKFKKKVQWGKEDMQHII